MNFMGLANLIHVLTSACWAGGTFLVAWFITPTAAASGEAGSTFMRNLVQGTKVSMYLNIASWVAILTGLYMYYFFSGGFNTGWMATPKGLAITISGLTAIAALTVGQAVSRPTANRLTALGQAIQAGGAPPTTEQVAEMGRLSQRMTSAGRLAAILLVLTIVGMALGRRML